MSTLHRISAAFCCLIIPAFVAADCGRTILEQPACVVDNILFACTSKNRYKERESYILQDEHDFYEKEVMASVMARQCELFVSGDLVWRVDTTGWDGFVSIRKKGQSKVYSIRNEALRTSTHPAS